VSGARASRLASFLIGGLLAAIGGVMACGGILPLTRSVRGEMVIEECMAERGPTRCEGTFTSEDGTVQHRVNTEVNDPRPARVTGWIDGPSGDRLHSELVSPVLPLLIGLLLLLVGPGIMISHTIDEWRAERDRRRRLR
jgi:hypothetical protein